MSHAEKFPNQSNLNTGKNSERQQDHQSNIKPAEGFELKQTRLAVHNVGKTVFGRIVPYYRLCVEGVDEKKEILHSVDIPAARFQTAVQLMKHAYESDERRPNEDFSQWGARKGYPFFSEMLEDILPVSPDDLPQLLGVKVSENIIEESGLHLI
ncbi:MAG: hypothetical protein OEX07_01090 [Gammaproteobacteria bacterium]|nr:hypothetical protein [Gammaproteobacteria bacterium]